MKLSLKISTLLIAAAVLYFPKQALALNAQAFEQVSLSVHQAYQPVFDQDALQLSIQARMESNRKNAFATRDMEDHPIIVVHGGMVRHPLMNRDALTTILCHEMGHFLGGAPKAFRGKSRRRSWSSSEGQADYFASSKCLKQIFTDPVENQQAVDALSPKVRQEAKQACLSSDRQCIRIAAAALRVTRLFAEIKFHQKPHFHTPDSHQVSETIMQHTSAQCRLDTFVAGALCSDGSDFDLNDPEIGACSRKNGQTKSARPRCWYSPEVH